MSQCCNSSTRNKCGDFTEPSNPDAGECFPYRLKISCEAPPIPVAECEDDEYTAEYFPDDPVRPFKILARLFDENCLPITDENDLPILTYIV